jgi:hypothetical protein
MGNVKQLRIQEFSISINEEFNDSGALSQSEIKLTPIIARPQDENAFIYIDFSAKVEGVKTEFVLKATTVMAFEIIARKRCTAEDVYKCVILTHRHVQNITNSIFHGHLIPAIASISQDELSDIISEIEQTLHQ